MNNKLQKIIGLVKKTGDRLVVYDSVNPDNVFVIMSIEEYESLILAKKQTKNLTEDELIDKINRDIALWKEERIGKELDDKNYCHENDFFAERRQNNTNWLNIDRGRNQKEKKIFSRGNHWGIPRDRKEGAEEVIIEEDRQYLEDVM